MRSSREDLVIAWVLTTVTIILILIGTMLFLSGHIGWAQALWVVASGTSGAAVVLWLERLF